MNCPKCLQTMETRSTHGIHLGECALCKGTWFEQGELDRIKDEIEPDLRWMDFDLWKWEGNFRMKVHPLKCPTCHQKNLHALYYDAGDVTINYCPSCDGIWLQAGDFYKIVIALNKVAENKSMADYFKVSLKKVTEIFTNPKELISEWRDLKSVMQFITRRFISKFRM